VEVPRELALARASLAGRHDLARQTRVQGDPKAWTDLQQSGEYALVSELEQLLTVRPTDINYASCGWFKRSVCAPVIASCRVHCSIFGGNPTQTRWCMEECVVGGGQPWCIDCI
jgi:hypothetical protein